MEQPDLNYLKIVIRSLLTSFPGKVTISQILNDYSNIEGCYLPYKHLGFKNVFELLENMKDVLKIPSNPNMSSFITLIVDEKTSHLRELVVNQKSKRHLSRRNNSVGRCDNNHLLKSANFKSCDYSHNNYKTEYSTPKDDYNAHGYDHIKIKPLSSKPNGIVTPNLKSFIENLCNTSSPEKTTTPMKKPIQQQSTPLHDGPSQQSTCSKPVVETQIPTASVIQTSPVKDFENKRIKLEDESSISEKSEVKWPVRRKINKKERKKSLNARMRRLVSPKSPLKVFSELFKDVPIQLQEHSINNVTGYTATLEIDGQMYTANHISKTQAKQKACENFLRIMLAKKISEPSEKKEESPMETVMEDGENGTVQKPNGPPQEDFPWPHFVSLAMHNLIHQWELQPVLKAINLQEEQPKVVKSPPKVKAGAMKKFPEDPKNWNPVQLINQMKPGVKFIETIISSTPSVFQVKCEIDTIPFTGQGSTKKAAKKECCIGAIKYFWHFDFHAIEADLLTKK